MEFISVCGFIGTESYSSGVSSAQHVTENGGPAAGLHESWTHEAGAGAKGERFIQVLWPGGMVDSHLKYRSPFPVKLRFLPG